MYGPGTGISVIAFPTGMAPFVVGSGGGEEVGVVRDVAEPEGLGDVAPPTGGVAGESVTGESLDTFTGAGRAQPAITDPPRAAVAIAKNPRRFIAIPPQCAG
jgi:hypothetical protein